MRPILTFVHITDTHLGSTPGYTFSGYAPDRHLERLVDLINAFPQPPDFVLHTGDVSNDRGAASYAAARAILSALKVPIYYVTGNHDDRALLRAVLGAPPHPSGDLNAPLDYTFEVQGERFVVLDTCDPAVRDPLGGVSPAQLAWLRAEIAPNGPPLTVILHHAPFQMASPWLDANMLLVNGAALHAALLPARDRLRGVFFGHLHRSVQIVRDGITYTCAPSGVGQYDWLPWNTAPAFDPNSPPGYHWVGYLDGQVVVQSYAFARP